MTGVIVRLNISRGFGFIERQHGPDTFFNVSDLVGLDFDEMLVDRRVEFDQVEAPKGPRAKRVRAAD